jgi:predicted nucleotide-binding protein
MDTESLAEFVSRIPNFAELSSSPRGLLRYFGYFVSEIAKQSTIRPVAIEQCFELARMDVPSNIPRWMTQSADFTKTRLGYQLHWKARQDIISQINQDGSVYPPIAKTTTTSVVAARERDVLVVYGRDETLRASVFQFLGALGLNPLEWGELVRRTGKASPHVWEVLELAFQQTQVVVVVFTPDEKCELRKDLQTEPEDISPVYQPRPNVLIEAGIALAKNEDRTLLVHIGRTRVISDLSGRHVLHLSNSSESRNDFAERLQTAGCHVLRSGRDWLKFGNFADPAKKFPISTKKFI